MDSRVYRQYEDQWRDPKTTTRTQGKWNKRVPWEYENWSWEVLKGETIPFLKKSHVTMQRTHAGVQVFTLTPSLCTKEELPQSSSTA